MTKPAIPIKSSLRRRVIPRRQVVYDSYNDYNASTTCFDNDGDDEGIVKYNKRCLRDRTIMHVRLDSAGLSYFTMPSSSPSDHHEHLDMHVFAQQPYQVSEVLVDISEFESVKEYVRRVYDFRGSDNESLLALNNTESLTVPLKSYFLRTESSTLSNSNQSTCTGLLTLRCRHALTHDM